MRRNLLLASAVCFLSVSIMAQNYAPTAWTFSKQEKGSAAGLFIKEMAAAHWNCKAPFRLGDHLDGSIGLACYVSGDLVGPITDDYAQMSEADKVSFGEFYKACQIVDGGELGNLFCYQGKGSTLSDSRAVQNTKAMPNSTLFWLSNTDIPLATNYRLSMGFRVIANSGQNSLKLTIATSHYDGIDNGTYREFELPFYAEYNDYWNNAILDFTIADNTDPNYKELPIVIKMWLGGGIENSILLLSDIKLEKIAATDDKYIPGKVEDVDWVDTPTGMSYEKADQKAVVWASNGEITVVDAKSPIKVYSVSGQLISFKAPVSNVTTIPVTQKGVYIVEIGDSSRKVVL